MTADNDDVKDISHMTPEEYQEEMRHIDQLATCPCTNCESRCWDTGEILECRAYRRWWYRNNGVNNVMIK